VAVSQDRGPEHAGEDSAASVVEAIERLERRVGQLAQQLNAGPNAETDRRLAELLRRFSRLEDEVARNAAQVTDLNHPAAGSEHSGGSASEELDQIVRQLASEVTAVRSGVAKLSEQVHADTAGRLDRILEALDTVQAGVDASAVAPALAAVPVQIEALGATAGEIRMRLDIVEELADRIADVRTALASDVAGIGATLTSVAESQTHVVTSVAEVNHNVAALSSSLAGLGGLGPDLAQRLTNLGSQLDVIDQRVSETAGAVAGSLRAELVGARLALRAAVAEQAAAIETSALARDQELRSALAEELTRQIAAVARAADEVAASAREATSEARRDDADARRAEAAARAQLEASSAAHQAALEQIGQQLEQLATDDRLSVVTATLSEGQSALRAGLRALADRLESLVLAEPASPAEVAEALTEVLPETLAQLIASARSDADDAQMAAVDIIRQDLIALATTMKSVSDATARTLADEAGRLASAAADAAERAATAAEQAAEATQGTAAEVVRVVSTALTHASGLAASAKEDHGAVAEQASAAAERASTAAEQAVEAMAALTQRWTAIPSAPSSDELRRIVGEVVSQALAETLTSTLADAVAGAIAGLAPPPPPPPAPADPADIAATIAPVLTAAIAGEVASALAHPPTPAPISGLAELGERLDRDLDIVSERIEALAEIIERSLRVYASIDTRERVATDVADRLGRLREAAAGVGDAVRAEAQRRRKRGP